jgi:beta-glucanase (GH16 family)
MRTIIFAVLFAALLLPILAEDWTTTDGKTYQQVTVVKTDDDAVTILDQDGGALVPLSTLPPDLQQRFHYDPAKAKIAAARRLAEDQANAQALADEKKTEAAQQQPVNPAPTPTPAPAVTLAQNNVTPVPPASTPADTTPAPSAPPASSTPPPASAQFTLNPGVSGASDAAHQKVNPNWKLVWSDEFDGDSLDTTKWNYEIDGKGGGNGELEYYTDKPENIHLENGHLLITAIKNGTDSEGKTHKFTSARITTKGKFSTKYGRFEARIKVPTGKGVWPAFWLMPEDSTYGGWASSGELDIMEEVGDKPNTAFGTIHYGDKWPRNVHTGDKYILPSGILADDWHVYAVEWEEGVIRWYIDGNLYETQTKWYTKAAPFPAPFDQNFYIILNFAVGGAWPGKPSADTPFPQTMDVDYVRVYQPN